jgi:hypothetical protein
VLVSEFAYSTSPYSRNGGLIGLAAVAIALGTAVSLIIKVSMLVNTWIRSFRLFYRVFMIMIRELDITPAKYLIKLNHSLYITSQKWPEGAYCYILIRYLTL